MKSPNLATGVTCFFKPQISLVLRTVVLIGLILAMSTSSANAQTQENQSQTQSHWSQFRGVENGEALRSAKPPVKWDAQQTAWEVDIPGTGWSSPVYANKRIWITSAVTELIGEKPVTKNRGAFELANLKTVAARIDLHAICVNLESGKLIHNIKLATVDRPESINPLNSYASPTPAISDGKIVCHFGSYGTWCLNEETGKPIWSKKFVVNHSVGPGSSPIIFENKVIMVCDGTDLQYITAVDINSGEEVWKTNRPPMRATSGEQRKAYSTPLVIDVAGKKQAVIPGAQWIASYNPSTGKELWRVDHGSGFSVTPMAAFDDGRVVFSTGYAKPQFIAIDPRGSGDVTASHVLWRARNAPAMPSFIIEDGRVFTISDKGIISCLDAKTGAVLNRERVGGNFSASPLLAGGKLYLSSREGKMTIVKCSVDLEKLGAQDFGSAIMASPILVENDLIVRTEKKLMRIKAK